jgi:type III pantothenate kinase
MPLPVRVDRPGEVGPDRLVNAYAAAHLYGTPAVVVDCGTATTLDAVDHVGAFVGGAIAPGLVLGLEALAAHTARLPRVEPRLPDGPIGRDTTTAIQVGTVLGHRAMIEGLLARMRRELAVGAGLAPHDVRVVLTGGLASLPWARTIEGVDAIDPDLTLRGLILFHRAVTGTGGLTRGRATGGAASSALGSRLDRGLQGRRSAAPPARRGPTSRCSATPSATRFVAP